MKFKPTLNRVLVKKLEGKEQVTEMGLLMSTHIPKNEAKVIAVGPGARYWNALTGEFVTTPVLFEPGQKVWVPEHNMAEVVLDGETYHLLTDDQILGYLEDEDAEKSRPVSLLSLD